jgi:hypothetical protein
MILSALLLLVIPFVDSGVSLGAPQDVVGTWTVVSQIVTQCSNDPYAPQPGAIMPSVTWIIADTANGPTLTSDKGSVSGQYTDSGAMFEFTTPILSIETSALSIKVDLILISTPKIDLWPFCLNRI